MGKVFQLVRLILTFLLELFFVRWRVSREQPTPASNLPHDPWATISPESRKEGHEVSDAKPGWVMVAIAGLFATIVIAMFFLHWMQGAMQNEKGKPAATGYAESFRHAPFAENSIARDVHQIDRETKKNLESYRWIDRKNGVVGIPISRALELVAAEGLPARAGTTPPFPSPAQEMLPLARTETAHDVTKSY